jgi:hypothetical protein
VIITIYSKSNASWSKWKVEGEFDLSPNLEKLKINGILDIWEQSKPDNHHEIIEIRIKMECQKDEVQKFNIVDIFNSSLSGRNSRFS